MFIPILCSTCLTAYDSEVIWAFVLSAEFAIYLMFSFVMGLPIKQHIALTLIGLAAVISNIETHSAWKKELRMECYHYITFCAIGANLIQA